MVPSMVQLKLAVFIIKFSRRKDRVFFYKWSSATDCSYVRPGIV